MVFMWETPVRIRPVSCLDPLPLSLSIKSVHKKSYTMSFSIKHFLRVKSQTKQAKSSLSNSPRIKDSINLIRTREELWPGKTVLTFFFYSTVNSIETALHLQALQRLKVIHVDASLFHHAPLFIVLIGLVMWRSKVIPICHGPWQACQQISKSNWISWGRKGGRTVWCLMDETGGWRVFWSLPLIHLASSRFSVYWHCLTAVLLQVWNVST